MHVSSRCAAVTRTNTRCSPSRHIQDAVAALACFDHGAHGRCRAASDVQGREAPGTLDLVTGGLPGHLQVAVEHHPYPGRPDRMSHTDETAARIHRQGAVPGGDAAVDRVAAAPGLGQTEVVDGHVLRAGEAVMGLDAVKGEDVLDPGPGEGVVDCVPNVREDVVSVGAGI